MFSVNQYPSLVVLLKIEYVIGSMDPPSQPRVFKIEYDLCGCGFNSHKLVHATAGTVEGGEGAGGGGRGRSAQTGTTGLVNSPSPYLCRRPGEGNSTLPLDRGLLRNTTFSLIPELIFTVHQC